MKQFKTYKELKKAVRKYWKRNAKKEIMHFNGKKCISYWTADIWCCYITNHIENYHRPGFQYDIDSDNLDTFIEKTNNLIGKKVKIGKTIGYLKGIAFANNGAYYAVEQINEFGDIDEQISLISLIEANEVTD